MPVYNAQTGSYDPDPVASQGVYWIGQDGKVYVSGSQGTNAAGVADSNTQQYWSSRGYQYIPDPNPPLNTDLTGANWIDTGGAATSGGGGYSGGGGAAAAPARTVNTAAVANTQKAIDSLGVEAETGNQNIADSYGSVIGKYDRESGKAEGDYTEQGITNNKNLIKNKQNALVAAAQGRRGLRGTLASLGALSGTGAELADRAVTQGANQDIGEATDTATTNAISLDKAIGNFRDEDKDRREAAQTEQTNQRTALEGSIAAKRQQFYQKMAELFSEGGNEGESANWLNRAGDLNNEIASKTRVAATPFTERTAAFTPGDLESYLAGTGDMTVSASNGVSSPLGTPTILAGRKKKKEEEAATV